MPARMRNMSSTVQTVTIVRPTQTYSKQVYPRNYLLLTDEEYASIKSPLLPGVWEILLEVQLPTSITIVQHSDSSPVLAEKLKQLTEKLDEDIGVQKTDYKTLTEDI